MHYTVNMKLYIYIHYNGAQIFRSFFTASLYFRRFSSVSPSFFSPTMASLYSCTAGCPSSSSLVPSSTSSFAPSGRMRRRVSRTFFWDGLSSHSYSSISARVFSCSHASVFYKTQRRDKKSFRRSVVKVFDWVEDKRCQL